MGSCRFVAPPEEGAQASHRPVAVEAPEPVTNERFPRRLRLRRGSELTACWEAGRRLRTAHLELAWRPNQTHHARVGIVVPRYQFSAVARNRLRRRLREILRRAVVAHWPALDVVLRAKRSAYAAPFAVLRAELTGAASRVA